MAEKGKGSSGADAKPAVAKKAKAADEAPLPAGSAVETAPAHDGEHLGHGGHPVDRREYFVVFGALFALTVLEVVLANPKLGISRTLVGLGLVGMAVTKAAMVGFFYMHLKHETKILKYTVAIPMATPAVYALVLVTEAAWRLTR